MFEREAFWCLMRDGMKQCKIGIGSTQTIERIKCRSAEHSTTFQSFSKPSRNARSPASMTQDEHHHQDHHYQPVQQQHGGYNSPYGTPVVTQVVVVSQPCLNYQSLHCLGIALALLSLIFSDLMQFITFCIFVAMRRELVAKHGDKGILLADLIVNAVITGYYLVIVILGFIMWFYIWYAWLLALLFLIPAIGVVFLLFGALKASNTVTAAVAYA